VERLRIGELLVQAKVLTAERLEDALVLQRAQGRKLGQVLIDLGIVTETQLTQALGQQLSVPWVSLSHVDFSRQLLNLVPREVAEQYSLIPIFVRRVRKQGDTLYVAMDDPTQEVALDAVRAASSMQVRPMIAAASELRSAIRVYYETGEPAAVPAAVAPPAVRPAPPPLPPPAPRPEAPPFRPPSGPSVVVEGAEDPPTDPTIEAAQPVATPPDDAPEAPPAPAPSPPEASAEPTAEPPPEPSPADAQPTDSPDAWPEVEAHAIELPPRKGGPRMVALTLLDGTTIRVPAKPRRGSAGEPKGDEGPGRPVGAMTVGALRKALESVARGADPRQVFGGRPQLETVCAALLALVIRKGLVSEDDVVDDLRKAT
jgi:type IV pilus assembly protein PilB